MSRTDRSQEWISQDTAILVIHGIGNQNPLDTLDRFTRSLLASFDGTTGDYAVTHQVAPKSSGKGDLWYDNFIRIKKRNSSSGHHLDVYEYYWAHHTQDSAGTQDINEWINKVAGEAKKFYRRNRHLTEKEKSSFFTREGTFRHRRYWLFLNVMARLIPFAQRMGFFLCWIMSKIPGFGKLIYPTIERLKKRMKGNFENVIGDIVVYNSVDVKSEFYKIRKSILDGAVAALRYLLEPSKHTPDRFRYERVIVAGHSLGSQISFDAINRLTHHINMGNVEGFDTDGTIIPQYRESLDSGCRSASDILSGLVTFGSPLDKIAFFQWKKAGEDQYLRAQILKNYHCFKQREELFKPGGYLCGGQQFDGSDIPDLESPFDPLFDRIRWYNFFDRRDYVSGHLDFYDQEKLLNIDCAFESRFYEFTHSWYWSEQKMFNRIAGDFLFPEQPPTV